MAQTPQRKQASFLSELTRYIFDDGSYVLQMSAVFGLMVFGAGLFLFDMAAIGMAVGLLVVGFVVYTVMSNL